MCFGGFRYFSARHGTAVREQPWSCWCAMMAYLAQSLRSLAAAICSRNGKSSPFANCQHLGGLHTVQLRHGTLKFFDKPLLLEAQDDRRCSRHFGPSILR